MAVREFEENEEPEWYSSDIPMLQFERINIFFKGGDSIALTTYQNDTTWGLCLIDGVGKSKLTTSKIDCIFRERLIKELPLGIISNICIKKNEYGDVSEINIKIESHDISFKAGEIYEERDNVLRVIYDDESVLVQVDGKMPANTPNKVDQRG